MLTEVRRYNPILFDFLLKRSLRWRGHRLGAVVFESRRMFMSVDKYGTADTGKFKSNATPIVTSTGLD